MKEILSKATILFVFIQFLAVGSFSWAGTGITAKLIKDAQKEGQVNWAVGLQREGTEPIAQKFQDTYGITVNITRLGTEALMGRFMMEMESKICKFDLLMTGKAPIGKYKEAGWLTQYFSPSLEKISPRVVEVVFNKPDGWWTPTYQDFHAMCYNSKYVDKKDAPKNWPDVLDPKYMSLMAHADPRYSGTAVLAVTALSDFYGWDYYKKLGKNKVMVVRGHGALIEMMKGGERPVAASMDIMVAGIAAQKKEPIVSVWPTDGAVPTPWQSFISSAAPHRNAAKLLLEFCLTEEMQKLAVEKGTVFPVIKGVSSPQGFPSVEDIKVMPVNIHKAEKESDVIKENFWKYM